MLFIYVNQQLFDSLYLKSNFEKAYVGDYLSPILL